MGWVPVPPAMCPPSSHAHGYVTPPSTLQPTLYPPRRIPSHSLMHRIPFAGRGRTREKGYPALTSNTQFDKERNTKKQIDHGRHLEASGWLEVEVRGGGGARSDRTGGFLSASAEKPKTTRDSQKVVEGLLVAM